MPAHPTDTYLEIYISFLVSELELSDEFASPTSKTLAGSDGQSKIDALTAVFQTDVTLDYDVIDRTQFGTSSTWTKSKRTNMNRLLRQQSRQK